MMKRCLMYAALGLSAVMTGQATCLGAFSPDGVWLREDDLEQIGDYYALVVGVSAYQHLPRLEAAAGDARQVAAALAAGYGFRQVVLLIDDGATHDAIRSALSGLAAKTGPKDSVLIYFAGRSAKRGGKGYWVPADGDTASGDRLLANAAIVSALEPKAFRARHVLIVSDGFFDPGLMERPQGGTRFTREFLLTAIRTSSRQCLTSGGMAPIVNSNVGARSVFCHYLLAGMAGVKRSVFVVGELYPRLRQYVFMMAPQSRANGGSLARQTPQFGAIAGAGHRPGGAFVFIRTTPEGRSIRAGRHAPSTPALKDESPDAVLARARGLLDRSKNRDALQVLHAYAEAGMAAGKLDEYSAAAKAVLGKSLGEALGDCRVAVKCRICKGEGALQCTKCKGQGSRSIEHSEVVVLKEAHTVLEDRGTYKREVQKPAVATALRWTETAPCRRCRGRGYRPCRTCNGTGCSQVNASKNTRVPSILDMEKPHLCQAMETRGDDFLSLASRAIRGQARATALDVRAIMVAEGCFAQAASLSPDAARTASIQKKIRKAKLDRERLERAMAKRWQDETLAARNDVAVQAAVVRRQYEERQKQEAKTQGKQ